MKKKFKTSNYSGFTLIELLVVVAILGIIAAIGISAYSGYVSSTKRKSAENILRQIALGQSEYYSENDIYFTTHSSQQCNPNKASSQTIENDLLGGAKTIYDENAKQPTSGYYMCVADDSASDYKAIAKEDGGSCKITLWGDGRIKKENC